MLRYMILDVDGTLTDSGIYYDDHGNEIKKFSTKDGTGIICAHAAGIRIIVLTGRECIATTRRLSELGVKDIFQGIKNKEEWIKKFIEEKALDKEELGYIGDDINDLKPMKLCGFIGCPSDSCEEVKNIASYVSSIKGGHGAARDVIEWYLKEQGCWDSIVNKVYGGV